jgi:hypothetical protein
MAYKTSTPLSKMEAHTLDSAVEHISPVAGFAFAQQTATHCKTTAEI